MQKLPPRPLRSQADTVSKIRYCTEGGRYRCYNIIEDDKLYYSLSSMMLSMETPNCDCDCESKNIYIKQFEQEKINSYEVQFYLI